MEGLKKNSSKDDEIVGHYKFWFLNTEYMINDNEGISEIEVKLALLKKDAIKYNKNKIILKYLKIDEECKDFGKKIVNASCMYAKIKELEDDDIKVLPLVEEEQVVGNNLNKSIHSKVTEADMNFMNNFANPSLNYDKSANFSKNYKIPSSNVVEEKKEEVVSR